MDMDSSDQFYSSKVMIFTLIFLLSAQCCMASLVDESLEIKTQFFEGEVRIIKFYDHVTRFLLVGSNSTVLDVRNDIHLRLVEDLHHLPKTFKILAPMTAVNVIAGEIPANHLHQYSLQYYLDLRQAYERNFIAKKPLSAKKKILSNINIYEILNLNLKEWKIYAQAMVHPEGWKAQLLPQDSGIVVMFFDSNSSMGLSVRPFYQDDNSRPATLVVGSYYPIGTLPEFTETFRKDLEREGAADLGPEYSVSATHAALQKIEVIKLIISPAR
jgi:hypothetical protein